MRYLATLLIVAAAITLSTWQAEPTRADTVTITVAGTKVDTGLNVRDGGKLSTQPTSTTYIGFGGFVPIAPEVPDAPLCTVIARIDSGLSVTPAFAPSIGDGVIHGSGRLYLGLNGASVIVCPQVIVTVLYVPPAPPDTSQPTAMPSPSPSPTPAARPVPPATPPQPPTNFRITSNAGGTIVLGWDAPTSGVSVYAANGCGCFTDAADGQATLTVANLAADTYQCFIAYAHTSAGSSDWSQWACDTVQP